MGISLFWLVENDS